MLLKVDHYTSLARAVARLGRDSYETRGAVYDRALTALVKRLDLVVPPLSQADIDMELLAFREAVRRVEFGDLDDQDWLAQQGTASELAPPIAPAVDPPDRNVDAPDEAPDEARVQAAAPKRRSVLGWVVRRTVVATVLIGLVIAGYAYSAGQLDLAPLARLLDRIAALEWLGGGGLSAQAPERAFYQEQGGSDPGSGPFAGKAFWRTRSDPARPERKPETVLTLDVEFPERGFSLATSMRHDASEGAALSHLIEFKFAGSAQFPVEGIVGVTGISLRGVEDKSGTALAGQSVMVAPGLFLFGLSADKEETRRNTDLLRTQPRLDILIALAEGKFGAIAVEKGESGERAFNEAFKQWTQ